MYKIVQKIKISNYLVERYDWGIHHIYPRQFKQFCLLNLTEMIESNLHNAGSSELHQTPIKKGKDALLIEPRTAESQQQHTLGLQDIDARLLFEDFSRIVKVSEDEDLPDEQKEVERKLDYETSIPKIKLMFSPKSSSMKKRQRICHDPEGEVKFESMVLFSVEQQKLPESEKWVGECESPMAVEREWSTTFVGRGWATQKKLVE